MTAEIQQKREQYILRCFACKTEFSIDDYGKFYRCSQCGNLLEVRRIASLSSSKSPRSVASFGVWNYFDLLPLWNRSNIVSLSEGGTALIECRNLAAFFGVKSLLVKFEGLNPTGSFKDRGMTVGVSKAKERRLQDSNVRVHWEHVGFTRSLRCKSSDEVYRSSTKGEDSHG